VCLQRIERNATGTHSTNERFDSAPQRRGRRLTSERGGDADHEGLIAPGDVADAWLVGPEVFWDRFQIMAERTLTDTALCWDVIKAARARLRGHPARLSGLFRRASERELARVAGIDEESRLRAALRALDGQWVDPDELGYDLAGHHVAVVGDDSPLLDAAARQTEGQLLRVQAPDGGIWGWLGGRPGFPRPTSTP
jgi:hypothetical protein